LIELTWPTLPFNPTTAPLDQALTPPEILGGPFGLIFFLVLVPFVRVAARRHPATAIIVAGLLWHTFTAGPFATLVIIAGLLVGIAWIHRLARAVAASRLSPRGMIAGVWIGLTALILPLWWQPTWSWYGWIDLRTAPLHFLGIAYFYLRLIAWGADLAAQPPSGDPPNSTPSGTPANSGGAPANRSVARASRGAPAHGRAGRPIAAPVSNRSDEQALAPVSRRWADTAAWLAYPPIMRLGPVMLRDDFLTRFDAWNRRAPIPWRQVGKRAALFILGGVALGVLGHNLAHVQPGTPDFFTRPDLYSTDILLGLVYGLPVQVYLLLWCYNELAAVIGLLIGIPVDNNFNWLPRATSIKDFWHRWHVTVGAWLRNYIYIPLGGNRTIAWLNMTAVFVFCGLWHGPAVAFLVWGLSQAFALAVQAAWERFADARGWQARKTNKAWAVLCWLLTMHYQIMTITVFLDFEHAGWRIFGALAARLSD
jgi:D-alanyl-lipoteichoic acid acyltransferase DltB (MBOAT superfamily)